MSARLGWTHPAGKINVSVQNLTVATQTADFTVNTGRNWLVLACGVRGAALDADRTVSLYIVNATNIHLVAPILTISSNVAAQFDLSQCNELCCDEDNELRMVCNFAGTDAQHKGWVLYKEIG